MKHYRFLLTLLGWMLACVNLQAHISFKKLTMQDGLADNMIFHIHKDHYGYIWFGNSNGLTRYDGHKIKNFELIEETSPITNIQEGQHGSFYLQSHNKILYFNYLLEEARPMTMTGKPQDIQATDFLLKPNRYLITCHDHAVHKLELKEETQVGTPEELFSIEGAHLEKICFNQDSTSLYAVTDRGEIRHYSLQQRQMLFSTTLSSSPLYLRGYVSSCQLHQNYLWITTRTQGIFIYDIVSQQKWHLKNDSDTSPSVLSHNDVLKILPLNPHTYLALTWSGYTLISQSSDTANWTTEICNESPEWTTERIETRMIAGYYDDAGILWVGTHGGGVLYSDQKRNFFKKYHQNLHNEIGGIATDAEQYVYLATYHQGILRSTEPFTDGQKELQFQSYFYQKGFNTFLCATQAHQGTLWFGGSRGMLLEKPATQHHLIPHPLPGGENIKSLLACQDKLWVGTSRGLFLYTTEQRHFEKIETALSQHEILTIEEESPSSLWVGTDQGLHKLCLQNGKWVEDPNYSYLAAQHIGPVNDILQTDSSSLYIATTKGLGILQLQKQTPVTFYSTVHGLCSDWIYCLTEDNNGHLWIGSNSGITHCIKGKHIFYNYYISNSIRCVHPQNGILFWGGSKDLTYFAPGKAIAAFETTQNRKAMFNELLVNGQPVPIGKSIKGQVILTRSLAEPHPITLHHANRDFSLSFSNLTYSDDLQKYSYRLYPYQKDWITDNSPGIVSYTNLPAGHYTFQIKSLSASGKDGPVNQLPLTILPHWSDSTWFRLLLLLLLGISLYLYIKRKERKLRLQEQHIQLKHELKLLNIEREHEKAIREERESFFIQTAHELRTPLTLILSPLQEIMQKRLDTYSNDELTRRLTQIQRNALSLQDLTNQLLYMQRIILGKVKLCLSHVDIISLIQSLSENFRDLSVINHIQYTLHIEVDSYYLWCDAEKLKSSIINLLSNAFKYTAPGGSITLRVTQTLIQEKRYCTISLTDTGIGMSEETVEHIFEPFFISKTTPTVSTQQGIGLHIVKHTIDLHHGIIKVHSQIGKGSTFTIHLPEGKEHYTQDEYTTTSEPIPQATPPQPSIPESLVATKKTKYTMLIIEDNHEVRSYIASLFQKQYTIYEATNGQEGVEIALSHLPNIIITDIMMPVKNGIECVNDLKKEYRTAHIPMIVLTAKVDDKDVIKALQAGADDYLIKPFNPEVLTAKVKNVIEGREKLKRIYTQSIMRKGADHHESDPHPEDPFMQQVINIIEQNFRNEQFDVAMLASCLNISQPTLRRKIKKYSKLSAMELIRHIRISKAAILLQKDCYSIQEVSEMVGYNDIKTFRKNFMDQFGVLPSKFEA